MSILRETLQYLATKSSVSERRIVALVLGNYFTVIELDDGSVGACMSYYRLSASALANVQERTESLLTRDPLLLEFLFDVNKPSPFVCSLRATVLSALSAPFLQNGGDATFSSGRNCPFGPFDGVRSALVIGFGGYMDKLAHHPEVIALHIADLTYKWRREEIERTLARYRAQYPTKDFTASDGSDTARHLREVDLVSITGSALCNNTLDSLLRQASGCPRIIIQGQSASIHPKPLFERGAHLVVTTVKPSELVGHAQADPDGRALRPFLEGGLPPLYLWPRNQSTVSGL